MKKIQKVIESCYDCEFRHVFSGGSGGSSKAHICRHIKIIDQDKVEDSDPFLLDVCDNGSHNLPIPKNCPLEDYKETPK
jgi:hypothetical protein